MAVLSKKSFEDELLRVMSHGILHLVGYDDHDEDDIRIIRRKEEEYVKRMKEKREESKE